MHLSFRVLTMFAQQINLSPLPNGKVGTDYAKNAWNTGLTIAMVTLTAVALLMIVINGLRYITSSGDPQKAGAARRGVLHAIIGLAVIWLARTIVVWALKGIMG